MTIRGRFADDPPTIGRRARAAMAGVAAGMPAKSRQKPTKADNKKIFRSSHSIPVRNRHPSP